MTWAALQSAAAWRFRPLLVRGRGAPLGDDSASRFLGVIAVLMGFLAALALAGALAVSNMTARWSAGLGAGFGRRPQRGVAGKARGGGAGVGAGDSRRAVRDVV